MTNKSTFSNRFRFPYHINIEERTDESPKWLSPILTLISVIAAPSFGLYGPGLVKACTGAGKYPVILAQGRPVHKESPKHERRIHGFTMSKP